jgi:hypothetical protein
VGGKLIVRTVTGKKPEVFNLRYLRLRFFYKAIKLVQPISRRGRMVQFEKILGPVPGTRVIDLGGTSEIWGLEIWGLVKTPLDITILNLPGTNQKEGAKRHHHFAFAEGDATELHEYPDNSFDIAFSNSVIEHVGGEENERKFAGEVRRLARSYFVQTPSVYFPIEAHTGVPFWWAIPRFIRAKMHKRWEHTLPAWNEMVANTTVIPRRRLQGYFPDGTVRTERLLGIPKSYYVYRVAVAGRSDFSTSAHHGHSVDLQFLIARRLIIAIQRAPVALPCTSGGLPRGRGRVVRSAFRKIASPFLFRHTVEAVARIVALLSWRAA